MSMMSLMCTWCKDTLAIVIYSVEIYALGAVRVKLVPVPELSEGGMFTCRGHPSLSDFPLYSLAITTS